MNLKKNILIINQYYPPDRSATAGILERIVKHICLSHRVIVLSGRPSYLILNSQKWKPIRAFKSKNVKIMRVGSTAFNRYTIFKRVSNYLSYIFLSFPVAFILEADVVFSMTDPPIAGFVAAITAKFKKKPFIYYIQDLHPDMAIASGMLKEGRITKLWDLAHLFVLKSANCIIAIGDDMKERIIEKGISANKIIVIRHGATLKKKSGKYDIDLIKKIRNKFSFTFVHSGNIGSYGAWEQLIYAIKMINFEKIGFIFIGDGQKKEKLIKLSSGIKNIIFLPFQPREKYGSILKASDVQIITIRKNLEGLVVPSKIYPILDANKPILGICSKKSDSAKIIEQYKCGLIADPDSAESIAEAILKFYKFKNRLHVYEKNSRFAANQFDQARLIGRLSKIIDIC